MDNLEKDQLQRILSSREFEDIDIILTETLESEYNETNTWVQLAAAFASMLVRNGHAFLDLSSPESLLRLNTPVLLQWPTLEQWNQWLEKSPACSHESDAYKPLILDQNSHLYLQRYFDHEQQIARSIAALTSDSKDAPNPQADIPAEVAQGLHEKQLQGIHGALQKQFFIITGGPGTGKTTTVLRFLVARLMQSERPEFLRIGVVAPTGKAAARLSESIAEGIEHTPAPQNIKERIAEIPCQTIHRILGSLPGVSNFRHNAKHPLAFDILVVDEASMIDLPLMRRFLDALPASAHLLLLGDPDQLSSVNVGSVFKDLLDASKQPKSSLAKNVCQLTKTHRFDESSGIFFLCNAIRANETQQIIETIDNNPFADLRVKMNADVDSSFRSIVDSGFTHWQEIVDCETIETALPKLTRHIALATLRQGRHGTREINDTVVQKIRNKSIQIEIQNLFHGLPIIVLENNYDTELYNGDLGLIWEQDGKLKAYFPTTSGAPRQFPISSLPRHEAAFALTIHKSQGSEFSSVSVLLSQLHENHLSKELIYTAFSRAKKQLTIVGDRLALLKGISSKVDRATGLVQKLS